MSVLSAQSFGTHEWAYGNQKIVDLLYGNQKVSQIYLGNILVWSPVSELKLIAPSISLLSDNKQLNIHDNDGHTEGYKIFVDDVFVQSIDKTQLNQPSTSIVQDNLSMTLQDGRAEFINIYVDDTLTLTLPAHPDQIATADTKMAAALQDPTKTVADTLSVGQKPVPITLGTVEYDVTLK